MAKRVIGIVFFVASLFGVRESGSRLAAYPSPVLPEEAEVLLLPQPQAVRALSFGYRNGLAAVLWFRTIGYFGKHFATDQRYPWLLDLCRLVTALTPEAAHVYEFGSLMLSWEAHDPQGAYALLSEAIENHPDAWKFPYLRGFVAFFFMNNPTAAHEDFLRAARMPGVHPLVLGLATKDLSGAGGPDAAIEFIETMLNSGLDAAARSALERRLMELQHAKGNTMQSDPNTAPLDSESLQHEGAVVLDSPLTVDAEAHNP